MDLKILESEVDYKAVTSSGPGGQHVNKVATKVILEWNVAESLALNQNAKERLLAAIANKITTDGRLLLSSQESRSQAKNKEIVFKKLLDLIQTGSQPKKMRLKRTTPASVKRKRLNDKKKHSEKKSNRNFRI
ncbi:MAG: aminoacyl-tRNA hydrolase [Nonlabens sp.]|nr:aminoacyl-tRNA hydrolase [Nonlabens sp.]